MSLVNALFSTLLFKANQSKFNRDKRNAQKTAYFKTGQKMKWAKKNKRRINGSREYQKQYQKEFQKVNDKNEVRQHFLSKLT